MVPIKGPELGWRGCNLIYLWLGLPKQVSSEMEPQREIWLVFIDFKPVDVGSAVAHRANELHVCSLEQTRACLVREEFIHSQIAGGLV